VRNRYIDLLRAIAIIRVVTYHTLGYWWLTVIFPAMGLMFALGGSLMAASLDRTGGSAVVRRLRRILPPVWVSGTIALATMHFFGGLPAHWRLLYWFVPLSDPPTNEWASHWLAMIWYIRSYVWFLVLSPVLLWFFRRWPIPSLLVPFSVLVTMVVSGSPLGTGGTVRDFFYYAPAWMLGFAHHDGTLQRLPKRLVWFVSSLLAIVGLALLFSAPGPRGYDLNDAPISDVLWSTAFLLVALCYAPKRLALGKTEPLVEAVNRRALTIYLWHQAAITIVVDAAAAVGFVWLPYSWDGLLELGLVLGLTAVLVLVLGWVEDIAARRKPRLLPIPRTKPVPERAPERGSVSAPDLVPAGSGTWVPEPANA
jgi:peptidoglycan/LPS O-acetylase OafA/YrhL